MYGHDGVGPAPSLGATVHTVGTTVPRDCLRMIIDTVVGMALVPRHQVHTFEISSFHFQFTS